jgi:hypothetical protein
VHQVVADLAAGDGLHRDGDAAVGAGQVGGDRVRAPLPHAVDVDADADVLARGVRAPAATGTDDDGGGVARLGVDRLDAAAQGGAGAQRVDEVEVVGGQQRRRDELRQLEHPVAQGDARRCRGRTRIGGRHASELSQP